MRKQVLSLLVENNPGVTSHISGLFSRRGYNIDSFSSGVTADPRYTRITIVATGDEQILEQIEKQLAKLEDVVDIKKLENGSSVTRELILVKIRAKDTERQPILNVTEIFHGKVVTDELLAAELGISIDELSEWQGQMKSSNLISLDEYTEAGSEIKMENVGNSHFDQPESVVEKEETKKKLVEAIDTLTEKERRVIVLYYYEDMTLKEISMTLEVSESRVSQLHTKALNKMKKVMGDYMFPA